MSFIGGKARNSEHILDVLNDPRYDGYDYLEPFVGMAHILRRVEGKRSYTAADANPLVHTLLRAVQRGTPLPKITRARYEQLRAATGHSLERAVAAFQYSFNGIEFGGYVHKYHRPHKTDDIPASRARYYAKLRESDSFRAARLLAADYRTLRPKNMLVYCDPPYRDTRGYSTGPFDHDAFWQAMRDWSRDNVVYVSEYSAPSDFVCVAKQRKKASLGGGHRQLDRVERLFTHRGSSRARSPCGSPPSRGSPARRR